MQHLQQQPLQCTTGSVEGAIGSVEGTTESVECAIGSVDGAIGSVEGTTESVEGATGSVEVTTGSVVEFVGRGGALVETMTFNQRVVGSNPALGKSFTCSCLCASA